MDDIAYYNEGVYLDNRDAMALAFINKDRVSFKHDVLKSSSRYADVIKFYHEYIDFASKFIREFGCTSNSIITSILIKKLIEMDVFSCNDFFYYTSKNNHDIDGFLGINVIKGHGCCRHVAYFHNDIFKKLGMMDIIFYCNFQKNDIDNAKDMRANHVINLINYGNNLYGYDISNDKLFHFVSKLKMEELFKDEASFVFYKPYIDMIVNSFSIEQVKRTLTIFDKLKDNKIISKEEYIDMCNRALGLVKENKDMIRDFTSESKKYTKKIVNSIYH